MNLLHTCLFLSILIFSASCSKETSSDGCAPTNEEIFRGIYERGEWGHGSGEGSKKESTKEYREFLQNFLKQHNIKRVVDVGCGDFEFSQLIDWSGIDYIGIDLVEAVIQRNQELHGKSNVQFIYANALTDDLPDADLVICKDVLQHLCHKDVLSLLKKFEKYSWNLITNDCSNPYAIVEQNADLQIAGGFRPLDLLSAPFNLDAKKVLSYAAKTGDKESQKDVLLIEKN